MRETCSDWGLRPNQDSFHTSMSNTYKVFGSFHMMWNCIRMCANHTMVTVIDQASEIHLEFWVTPPQQMIATSNDWGFRPNQHFSHINVEHIQGVWQPSLMWMCIWMCLNHTMAAVIDQVFGSDSEFWVTPRQQMIVTRGDWGYRPNQHSSHINVKHMQGIWQPSYDVDVHMNVS